MPFEYYNPTILVEVIFLSIHLVFLVPVPFKNKPAFSKHFFGISIRCLSMLQQKKLFNQNEWSGFSLSDTKV